MMYWIKKIFRDPSCPIRHYVETGYRFRAEPAYTDINTAHYRASQINRDYSNLKCECRCAVVDHDNDPIM